MTGTEFVAIVEAKRRRLQLSFLDMCEQAGVDVEEYMQLLQWPDQNILKSKELRERLRVWAKDAFRPGTWPAYVVCPNCKEPLLVSVRLWEGQPDLLEGEPS